MAGSILCTQARNQTGCVVTTRRMPCRRQDARRDGWDHVKPDGAVLFSRKSYRECTQRQKAAVWLCEGCHTHQRTTSMLAGRAGLCWLGERWGKMLCRPK